ncbi:MAG: 4Fe-4S binding protein [Anaerolineae bacterium]|nr:4Fe-4S binding protein [Anaerolineae bacterium]
MTAIAHAQEGSPRMAIWKAVLLTLPAALFSYSQLLRLLGIEGVPLLALVAALLVGTLLTIFFFLMVRTGKTHRYRSVLFIVLALTLPLHFIPMMVEARGTNVLTPEAEHSGEAPFCPLTMPMVILPAVVGKGAIFPGVLTEGAMWFFVWVGLSLSIGRGWCSWGCFYGGYDELFSRLRKKAVIKHVDRKWRFLPYAVLLAIVLLSAIVFHPIYCEWLCPFKMVTEFNAPRSLATIIALVIFVSLFLGLVVALPLLTKKRIQCALWCPFGALQSFFNKINIFELRIDLDKCTQCKRCLRECPTFSLDEGSLVSGKALMTCTKCGQCVDACPKGAMSYHIKGTPVGIRPNVARMLFLYPTYVLVGVLGGNVMTDALFNIFQWITTGSMITPVG